MFKSVLLTCLVFSCFVAAVTSNGSLTAAKNYLDLSEPEDNVLLWQSLFTKINTLLSERNRLSESLDLLTVSLSQINQRLWDFTVLSRQKDQETLLNGFMQNTQRQLGDIKREHDELARKLTNHMEDSAKYLNDLIKRQTAEENLLKQNFENLHEWQTVLRREDGSVDFYRNWEDYEKGFGNPDDEFFIGLQELYALTTEGPPKELLIVLKDFEGETRFAKYDRFAIGNEYEKYALKVLGIYSGNAGDSLTSHKDMKFTTFDRDNDEYAPLNCAESWRGAWWFKSCYDSHLFGPYRPKNETKRGIGWHSWKPSNSPLKFAEMKIRSKTYID